MLTVIDTGAGPNLIRLGAYPEVALRSMDTTRRIANLRGASRHQLHTLGIVNHMAQIATQFSRVPFVVVRNLGADALLGCSYTYEFKEAIMCTRRPIILENGEIVPIQRRKALKSISGDYEEQKAVESRAATSVNAVCTAERVRILANLEKVIAVKSYHVVPRLIKPLSALSRRKS